MATSTQTLQSVDNLIVPHPVTLELYRKMLTVYYFEERMKIFVRQGKCGFQASTRGHEKLQIGMTMLLKPRNPGRQILIPVAKQVKELVEPRQDGGRGESDVQDLVSLPDGTAAFRRKEVGINICDCTHTASIWTE
jgi:hypothetical protein